jgi:hypothetical protein
LQEYQQLCSSLRVLNLFCSHVHFFLSAFQNPEKLHQIFDSNQKFLLLNQKLTDLFMRESKQLQRSLTHCKGKYYCALKGIDFIENRKMKPTGIEAGNFCELSAFFENHPIIKNFFDDHLNEIEQYANLYKQKHSKQTTTQRNFTVRVFSSNDFKEIKKRKFSSVSTSSSKTFIFK